MLRLFAPNTVPVAQVPSTKNVVDRYMGRPAAGLRLMLCSTAYAIGLADYIVQTTDPTGDQWEADRDNWLDDIRVFSKTTRLMDSPFWTLKW